VIDLFGCAGAADQRDVQRVGQQRLRRAHRAFHIEPDRQDRKTWRRLHVTNGALVYAAHDDGCPGPQLITSPEHELQGLGQRRNDQVEPLITVFRREDRA